MPLPTTTRRAATIAVVAVLGVVVIVLSVLALTRPQPEVADGSPAPLSTFSPTPSATPTPTATPTPSSAAVSRADERFLSFAGGSGWRATAGSCEGTAPVLQRMDDAGAWVDVVPREHRLRQIASLDAYADGAELVGGVDDGCIAASLRSFSAGVAWESYPDALALSRYIDLSDPALVHTRAGDIAAPCAAATGLRAWGDVVALICDGQAWRQTDDTWTALEPTGVRALAIDDTDLIIGHESAECAGLALTRIAGDTSSAIGCAEGVDVAQPLAVASVDGGVAVWAGDEIIEVNE